ncbi:MAG: hypothetical protein AAF546_01110 [Verrucomicrobiota bacterium]
MFAQAGAVTSYSPTMGGIELVANGLRETSHGLPLHRAPVVVAELGEVAANSVNDVNGNFLSRRLTFTDTIGMEGQFNPDAETGELTHFVEFVRGEAMGQRLPIVGSGSNWVAVSVDPIGTFQAYFGPEDPMAALRDLVYIRPYWTLETALNSITVSSYDSNDPAASRNGDAILIPTAGGPRASRMFQKFGTSPDDYWGELSPSGVAAMDGGALETGSAYQIRLASETPLTYFVTGEATSLQDWNLPAPEPGTLLEIPFSLEISDPITLGESGLDQLFTAVASAQNRIDELIVWDTHAGFHPRPARRFYLESGSPSPVWREVGDPVADQGSFELEPGQGYLIRRRGL